MAASLIAAMIGAYAARRNVNRTEPDSGSRLAPKASPAATAVVVRVARGLVPPGVTSRKAEASCRQRAIA